MLFVFLGSILSELLVSIIVEFLIYIFSTYGDSEFYFKFVSIESLRIANNYSFYNLNY